MTKIIVFTGIDGAGKTTQARLLRDTLQEQGLSVQYEHLTGPNLAITRKIKNRVGEKFLDREDKRQLETSDNGSGGFSPIGLFFIYRGIWQSWYNVLSNRDCDVLILDRYLYDDLVRVHWKYDYNPRWLSKLTPLVQSPDLVIYLDCDPEVAWNREINTRTTKQQHKNKVVSIEQLADYTNDFSGAVRLDTTEATITEINKKIFLAAKKRLDINI